MTTKWNDQSFWAESGFLQFLTDQNISENDLIPSPLTSESIYANLRYFRLKQAYVEMLEKQNLNPVQAIQASLAKANVIGVVPIAIPWLKGFYGIPANVSLSNLDLYLQGNLNGIDISSGYAVALLDIQPGDHVLDLCCAPGAKLAYIADLLQNNGSITGVDFSAPRINACKNVVYKYGLLENAVDKNCQGNWRCRLYCGDGRNFSIGPMTDNIHPDLQTILDSEEHKSRSLHGKSRKRMNKSARAREKMRKLSAITANKGYPTEAELYDKVLVDAECTHDGSIRHLQKLTTLEAWKEYVKSHLNDKEISRIINLQQDLLHNGYSLLKNNGVLVYSTCSLSPQQNENIIASFLETHPSAKLEIINPDASIPCQVGKVHGTIRFTPSKHTSGLYIAKLRKLCVNS